MNDDLDPQLLARFVGATASAADLAAIDAWCASRPDRRDEMDRLRAMWSAAAGMPTSREIDASLGAVLDRLALDPSLVARPLSIVRTPTETPAVATRPNWGRRVTRWAVAAAIGCAAVMIVGIMAGRRPSPSAAGGRVYAAGRGQRERVTLADGTEIVLAPASTLRLSPVYGQSRRDVRLEGEASFAVTHDSRHPFAVYAGNAIAEDIGTRFIVRSYAGEPAVRVVVADGRVALRDTAARPVSTRTLSRGAMGEVDHAGVTHVTSDVATASDFSWATGQLVFTDRPLGEVVADLSRWYDMDISVVGGRLAERRVSLAVTDASRDVVLDGLAASIGARLERRDTAVVLSGGGGR